MNFTETKTLEYDTISIKNYLPKLGIDDIRKEVFNGLMSDRKYIASKFFYNDKGSALFEEITHLPEYYLTITEKSILKAHLPALVNNLTDATIIELGSGDCSKISILLNSIKSENLNSINYVAVDVSLPAIKKSADLLRNKFPDIMIQGLVADFINQLHFIPKTQHNIFCFFGSTLGNFTRQQSISFLKKISDVMMPGDQLLLGLDMVKDKSILEAAYNDSKNITAAFNKNILNVINHLADTNFDVNAFEHRAFYNSDAQRIEMHLRALHEMKISSSFLSNEILLEKGETVHTENSHKYTIKQIEDYALHTGMSIENIFTDNNHWFSVVHFLK